MDATTLGLLAGTLALLTLGAELLVRGAVAVARRLGVSSFFIGLTIVGFGTSTPELFASLTAALRGQDDLAVGNVVGSNVFNIAAILGIAALICPIPVKVAIVRGEVWIVIATAATPWIGAATGGTVERWLGASFLLGLVIYLWRGFVVGRREGASELEAFEHVGVEIPPRARDRILDLGMIVVGLGFLVAGSTLLIDSAAAIARSLGVSELAIGLTIVAGGTSAPELVTSVVAALRRQPDIAVGNVLGSNIFNLLGILGLTSVVEPQQLSPQVTALDTPVMFAASVALLPIVGTGARISRTEGLVLLVCYVGYVVVLFTWAPAWF